jgi:tetratricopeptide (TPR) repeat protein
MNTLDFPPTHFEVENQLKRILASPRFRNAPNPSAFLEIGVVRALNGKKTTGNIVAKALFGAKFIQGESADVRITARNLRKTLDKYYEREGSTDVVIISYPVPSQDTSVRLIEGEAYTPRFSHNPKHETFIQVRFGYRFLEQSTYRDLCNALSVFTQILEDEPDNLGALLGLAETLCKFGDNSWLPPWKVSNQLAARLCGEGTWNPQLKIPGLSICINIFAGLEKRADDYWRFWAARAYFYMRKNEPKLVSACFEKALNLNRFATESFIPYIEFLIDSGKADEAVGLAQRYVNEYIEDSLAVAQFGQILYFAGRQDTGMAHLQAALLMDPGNCLAHQTMAMIHFIRKDVEGLYAHLQALHALCDAETFLHFSTLLKEHENQYELKGCIANLLSKLPSAASVAVVKL